MLYVVIAIVLLLLIIFAYRGCTKKNVKIDLETVDKINNGNRKEREAELQKTIENNADVVRTADNRTAITDTNVVERDRIIAEKVKAADAEILKAKSEGRDVTAQQLECLLVPENCQ